MQVTDNFNQAATSIIQTAQRIHQRGWSPATSSNYSLRLDSVSCAITVSGKDKGNLYSGDVMRVDLSGRPLPGEVARPSAEALLHTSLYDRDPMIGAVLHTHSLAAVLAAETVPSREPWGMLELCNLELLKAFAGNDSHESVLRIPVFANTQDIAALAQLVDECLDVHGPIHAYLIRGHGSYTWGRDMSEATRHLEALEYLMEYTWRTKGLRQHDAGRLS